MARSKKAPARLRLVVELDNTFGDSLDYQTIKALLAKHVEGFRPGFVPVYLSIEAVDKPKVKS